MSKGQIAKRLLEFVASSGRPDAKISMAKKKAKAPTKRTTRSKTEQDSWEKVKKVKAEDRSASQKKTHAKLAKLKPFKEKKAKAKVNRSFKKKYEVEGGTGSESRGRSGSSDKSEFEVELGRAGKVTVGKASGANFLKDQAAVGGTRARAKICGGLRRNPASLLAGGRNPASLLAGAPGGARLPAAGAMNIRPPPLR